MPNAQSCFGTKPSPVGSLILVGLVLFMGIERMGGCAIDIAITSSGTVKVGGGFVASTLDLPDADFDSDQLSFKGKGTSARVSNEE